MQSLKKRSANRGWRKKILGVIPGCTLVLMVMALTAHKENTVGVTAAVLTNLAAEPYSIIYSNSGTFTGGSNGGASFSGTAQVAL